MRRTFEGYPNVRFALGAHPLNAGRLTPGEWAIFYRSLPDTSYVGEVGLDFSQEGVGTRVLQEHMFRRVLEGVAGTGKVLTVHSRRAEAAVLELLTEYRVERAIFHWYSGSLGVLERVIESRHFLSFNPAMTLSKGGPRVIERVPAERALVETDGPYVSLQGRPVTPSDVGMVYAYLVKMWQRSLEEVAAQILGNFRLLTGGAENRE
jgi:TatD DNase family protein